MLKKLSILFCSVIIAFAFSACDSSSGEKDKDAPAEYTAMSGAVYSAVFSAMTEAMVPTGKIARADGPMTVSGDGWSGTIGISAAGDVTTSTIHIEWTGYTYGGVTLSGGFVDITYNMNTVTGNFYFNYSGEFDVLYDTVNYDFGWDIEVSVTGTEYAYNGEYTVEGETYTWSYSGK